MSREMTVVEGNVFKFVFADRIMTQICVGFSGKRKFNEIIESLAFLTMLTKYGFVAATAAATNPGNNV
jgi:hypothetical protein